MSAPNGFDATATALPGGGHIPSTPIHVQQGGNPNASSDDGKNEILKKYGLDPGGIIDDVIDQPTKNAFLEQYLSGACSFDSGDSIILKKNCWAVSAVIRALIKHDLNDYNSDSAPAPDATAAPAATATAAPAAAAAPAVKGGGFKTRKRRANRKL
jgi:hypothetical protein